MKRCSWSTQLLAEGILLVGVKRNWEASFEYLLLIYLHNNRDEKKSHIADNGCITDILKVYRLRLKLSSEKIFSYIIT
jgi:hypothetical protein